MTIDVAAFQPTSDPTQPYIAALATSTSGGRVITGIEKLTQRFLLELLTERGSMKFLENRGSNFTQLLKNAVINEADILTAFTVAMISVAENLQTEESKVDTDDERFASANLYRIDVSANNVKLYIQIYNRLGQYGNVNYPLVIQTVN